MSASTNPAAVVSAPVTSAVPTHPRAEDSGHRTVAPPIITGHVPSSLEKISPPAPLPMTASPAIDTTENVLPSNNFPPKRKASHKPGYLDYDEKKFQQALDGLADAAGWAERHREVNKTMVRSCVFVAFMYVSFTAWTG
jgi:hypothetical protein